MNKPKPTLSDVGLFCLAISAGESGIGHATAELHNYFERVGAKYAIPMKPTYPDFPFSIYRSLEDAGDQEIEIALQVTHYKPPGDNGSLDRRDPAYEPGEVEFGDAVSVATGKTVRLTELELERAETEFWSQ